MPLKTLALWFCVGCRVAESQIGCHSQSWTGDTLALPDYISAKHMRPEQMSCLPERGPHGFVLDVGSLEIWKFGSRGA